MSWLSTLPRSSCCYRLLAIGLTLAPTAAPAAEPFFLRDGQRVLFLGDSNTFAGLFIADLDGYLVTRFPDKKFDLINLGLPSETVSGLSELDHPYPRPDVHERLDRALVATKPDVVVACYGMNDGIYHPFSEDRFKQYQAGFRKLIGRVKKSGATFVLMTPPPFDPRPVRKKLLPASAERFSWMRPYENYDDVLTRYSDWLLTLRTESFTVVDAHAAVVRHLAAARKSDPAYHVSGDGIHPNAAGHWVIARELLLAWHAPADVDAADIDAKTGKAARGDVRDLAADKDGVRFTWRTRLPLPVGAKERPLAQQEGINDRLNRHHLTVRGLPASRYNLAEGDHRLATLTADALAAGVDLLPFTDLTSNRRSAEVGKLVAERQQLLGLAWLTSVGHKRPDTPKGLPLEEANAKAAELEKRSRELARPVELRLRLTPVEAAPGLQGTGKEK